MSHTAQTLKEAWKKKIEASAASNDGWLTIDQLAAALGVSRSSISNAIIFGKIPGIIKLGEDSRKDMKVTKDWLRDYIKKTMELWGNRLDKLDGVWVSGKDMWKVLRLPYIQGDGDNLKISEKGTKYPIIIPLGSALHYIDNLTVINERGGTDDIDPFLRPDGLREGILLPEFFDIVKK